MVRIDAGEITLNDEGTHRKWTVQLRPYVIHEYAVTQEQYFQVSHGRNVAVNDRNKPVVDVSWIEAIRFCNRLSREAGMSECYSSDPTGEVSCDWDLDGYRLPSEAEWEYACRAGSTDVRYGELDDIAWYRNNSAHRLHPVGTRKPNDWGLYDMIGNVWEWCWDTYDAQVYGPYRVFRGGGWCDPPRGCRASCRRKSHPAFRMDDLGFRLARSLT
jgi:formylglycine-generating enzyme required for sulfatase activity